MDLASRLRELKRRSGLTTTALAQPRYSVSYVSRIESGHRRPSPEALAYLADRLGVSPEYLATGIPDGLEPNLRLRLEDAQRNLHAETASIAEESLRKLLAEAGEYGLEKLRAHILAALGVALRLQARFREAIGALEEAMEVGLPRIDEGLVLGELARAYRSVGDLSYAIELVNSYLDRRGEEPLDPSVATDLHSVLVSIYFERGDIVRAEAAAERALAAADSLGPSDVRAVAYWHASRVLAERKRWDEALELAGRARILLELSNDRRRIARVHNAYAFLCLEAEPPRIEEARRSLDIAEAKLTEASSPGDIAYVLTERSRLALLEGKAEEALELSERALAETATDDLERGRCLFLKGRALATLDRRPEARDALQEASAEFEKHGARQQQAACWREIAEFDLAAGDVAAAVEAFRSGFEALDPRRSRT
jgi:tetratricopeptide (TPR) repeat protein